ncbi:MAG TPA: glycosyltransferase [Opitutaceae bacterium]|jgi:glycosyltransferase involved in cell wall biosynthesis|nr:glycosyltransferase [Opitutaceae bacterium]
MGTFQHTPPFGGAFSRRFTRYTGIYFDEFRTDSAWIRETAILHLPAMVGTSTVFLKGDFQHHPDAKGPERTFPHLEVFVDGDHVASIASRQAGPWELKLPLDPVAARKGVVISLRLRGADFTNALAWLGRVTMIGPLQRYRQQNHNRQLRLFSIEADTGEKIYDFSMRESPFSTEFARSHTRTGLNIVGFLTADLGIGESARRMVRAADAAGIPTSLVQLKLNCRNRLGDLTFEKRLQEDNPQGANVFHIDPPVSRDVDHHHGQAFRKNKYNIGYFAWELPEFPDSWTSAFDYFDEIWCPSNFVTQAVSLKSPVPVVTMPHSVEFERPKEPEQQLRARFGLPADKFLFLCLFDLNSYTERKNPRAVIEAFRRSGLAGHGSCLVIKVHNADVNPGDFAALQDAVSDLPGTVIISATLSRADVYALEAACDCFVSLHRSEGFGFAIAECMYLGKPVIATDWSATAEYLDRQNGLPVRYALVKLTENHGPYTKGSVWAEPDIGHAAELMSKVVSDKELTAWLGTAAKRTIEERFSPEVIGARYQRRLEAIAGI